MLVVLRGSRSRRAARCVGSLRAVLGHCAGCSLPLPQAKPPSALARRVIDFGPEPWQWGSGSFASRVGVGRRNGRLHRWVRAHLRKIRSQFQGGKHTSLAFYVILLYELRLYGVLRSSLPRGLVTLAVTLRRRQRCRVVS